MINITIADPATKGEVALVIGNEAQSSLKLFVQGSEQYADELALLAKNTIDVVARIVEMHPPPIIEVENAKVETAQAAAQAAKEALRPTLTSKAAEVVVEAQPLQP